MAISVRYVLSAGGEGGIIQIQAGSVFPPPSPSPHPSIPLVVKYMAVRLGGPTFFHHLGPDLCSQSGLVHACLSRDTGLHVELRCTECMG
jgi:hypothetical protein